MVLEVPKEAEVWKIFEVEARVSFENNLDIQSVEIGGMENFREVSTEQKQEIRSLNWQTKAVLIFRIGIIWKKEWLYKLWPLKIVTASWNFESNEALIKLISWSSSHIQKNTLSSDQIPYDIYPPRTIIWDFAPYTLLLFSGLFLFFILFFVLKKYFSWSGEKQQEWVSLEKPLTREDIYIEKFSSIPLEQEKWEFYKQFQSILRSYFKELWIQDIEMMTYADTKKIKIWKWNLSKYEKIFKQTYFEAFSALGDEDQTFEKRKQYVDEICFLLLSS